jgi:hypothetical protein
LKKEKRNMLSLLLKAFNGEKMYNKVYGKANNNVCHFIVSLLLKPFNGKKCITKFMEKPTIKYVFS